MNMLIFYVRRMAETITFQANTIYIEMNMTIDFHEYFPLDSLNWIR